jgi:hypothetical protein
MGDISVDKRLSRLGIQGGRRVDEKVVWGGEEVTEDWSQVRDMTEVIVEGVTARGDRPLRHWLSIFLCGEPQYCQPSTVYEHDR